MKISFHGAAQGVTGSCHMIECNGRRVLIDCGLYQGGREIAEENTRSFGFEPESIDFLLLTHAHLDHCGRIPLLAKRGFSGEVITTAASTELARLVLLDSAGLQEEEAVYQQRRARKYGDRDADAIQPLYTTLDALNCLCLFGRTVGYRETLELADGLQATFFDAGHILGSACILLELCEDGRKHRVLFSGDLGFSGRAILRDPAQPPHADTVVMETTYGDRRHKLLEPSVVELYDAVNTTMERGGNVIIPTFALERAQEVLYYLREGRESGAIKQPIDVYLDSPMAISATEIFRRHPECFDEETLTLYQGGRDPFDFSHLHFTRETGESIALNSVSRGAVILAGSGMCTGGRVRHHLRQHLSRQESSIVFVGFAAAGTLARRIVDGAAEVRIFGKEIPVRARVYTINGFSAHGDQDQLLAWHAQTGNPARTFLVHGESDAMTAFAGKLDGTQVEMPALHQAFDL